MVSNTKIPIKFNALGDITDVGIDYTFDKVIWHEIAPGFPTNTNPNAGCINTYNWNVPLDFTLKTDCWIRVRNLEFEEFIKDVSDKPVKFLKWRKFVRKENMGM